MRPYSTKEMREIAACKSSPELPFLMDTMRDVIRYAADVIDAADDAIYGSRFKSPLYKASMAGQTGEN